MTRRPVFEFFAALLVAVFVTSGAAAEEKDTSVVATVDGEPVYAREVRELLESDDLRHEALYLGGLELREMALERVLRKKLILAQVKKRNLLDGDLGDRLRAVMIPGKYAIYGRVRVRDFEVSEAEIDALARPGDMERRRVSYIVTTEEDRVNEIWRRAKGGEDFASLAREYSEGPGNEAGGDLGFLEKGRKSYFTDAMWEEIFQLERGGITAIHPSLLFGKTFARVDEIERFSDHEISEIRRGAENKIRQDRLNEEIEGFVQKAGLRILEDKLAEIAALSREEPVATFKGGAVSAGLLRGYLVRRNIQAATATMETLRYETGELAKQIITVPQVEDRLRAEEGYAEGIAKARENALVRLYFELLYEEVTVSDAEIEEYRRRHPELGAQPAQVRLRQIRLTSKEEAEEVHRLLEEGGDFESLAIRFAITNQERRSAGFVGDVTRDKLPPPIDDIVFSLTPGAYSDPVETRFGYYIFSVQEKQQETVLDPAKITTIIRNTLREKKNREKFDSDILRMKGEHEIVIDRKALRAI